MSGERKDDAMLSDLAAAWLKKMARRTWACRLLTTRNAKTGELTEAAMSGLTTADGRTKRAVENRARDVAERMRAALFPEMIVSLTSVSDHWGNALVEIHWRKPATDELKINKRKKT